MGSTSKAAMLFYCVALSVVAVGFAVPEKSPKFISMGALECDNITATTSSRKLAQVECPVRFEHVPGLDTVIKSCRGVPSPQRCCGALKTFACPYRDLIDDNDQNGCAS
ncbi:hypothetical protein HU200_032429 [Digitaria exilis]|uniref:GPI-anchored protein LLG1-like domain-containing protein n=1 Tax=Digitaria exilis TaxID=1010633 RepID=A0A835BNZ3_9POAL|nr:hypothetical protein HU200_032429 [Digitaria exilis]